MTANLTLHAWQLANDCPSTRIRSPKRSVWVVNGAGLPDVLVKEKPVDTPTVYGYTMTLSGSR